MNAENKHSTANTIKMKKKLFAAGKDLNFKNTRIAEKTETPAKTV